MSTLYKKSNSPYWQWSKRSDGRRFTKSTKMTNKSLAKKLQQQWDFNIMNGDFSFIGLNSDSSYYLEKYKDEYLRYFSTRNRNHAIKVAKGVLNNFMRYTNKKQMKYIKDVKVKTINGYIDSLNRAHKTKKNHLQVLTSMFNQAIKDEIIKDNPCVLATLPKITNEEIKAKRKRHRPLEHLDLEIIFKSSGKWYMYYAFLYHTGLRAGDIALLKYENIDFKKKAIVSLIRKSRRIHEFPIANVLLDMLDKRSEKDSPLFPTLYSDSESTLNDKLFTPRNYMQSILALNDREKATLHSFRHTFNNSLRDLGLKIEDRQVLLAHASSSTNKIYTHPNFDLASQYVNKVPMYDKISSVAIV